MEDTQSAPNSKESDINQDKQDGPTKSPPDIDEMRNMLVALQEKQNKIEQSFGVDRVALKDVGDRVQITVDTTFGSIITHAEKAGAYTPVTYSGSTVAGNVHQTGHGSGKGGAQHGMTPEQLQEFKKQSLQIGAAQQKLKELESKLNDASSAIRKEKEKSTSLEEKELEHIKELYAHVDVINSVLSEKIAVMKVEVQKIAGDTPKPINYDPFNYGEAYAGDLVDFQARKRITELKLLMQGLQAALLQMRDAMKVSPGIDLGYKVVRLDQLVGSTGFGQKVNKGEVGPDEVLLVEQNTDRVPGRVEYPKKNMFQTSPGQESKWSITDSIMQTMYRLEMELGDVQKIVEKTGLGGGSKIIEEVQQSIKTVKDKQLDVKTVKRMIDDSKESAINQLGSRKSTLVSGHRSNSYSHQENSDGANTGNLAVIRKLEAAVKKLQKSVNDITATVSRGRRDVNATNVPSQDTQKTPGTKSSTHCLSCENVVCDGKSEGAAVSVHRLFNPDALIPRLKGPVSHQLALNRTYKFDLHRDKPEEFSIPRPCGAGYKEFWPLPKNFDSERFSNLFHPPPMMADTRYIKGKDGQYYKGTVYKPSSYQAKREVPMTISVNPSPGASSAKLQGKRSTDTSLLHVNQSVTQAPSEPGDDEEELPVRVLVSAASFDNHSRMEAIEMEEQIKRAKQMEEKARRDSATKKYKFTLPDDLSDEEKPEGRKGSEPVVEEGDEEEVVQEKGKDGEVEGEEEEGRMVEEVKEEVEQSQDQEGVREEGKDGEQEREKEGEQNGEEEESAKPAQEIQGEEGGVSPVKEETVEEDGGEKAGEDNGGNTGGE